MSSDSRSVVGKARALRLSPSKLGLLVRLDGKEKWLPLSCIHDDSEVYRPGDDGLLILKRWFAEREGL